MSLMPFFISTGIRLVPYSKGITEHIVPPDARDVVFEYGARRRCKLCGETGGYVVRSSLKRYQNLFEAPVRLHLSEWEYNGYLGLFRRPGRACWKDARMRPGGVDALAATRSSRMRYRRRRISWNHNWHYASVDALTA